MSGMTETVSIPRRFNGPPGSGHGGYVAGVVADLVLTPSGGAVGVAVGRGVEVTLRKPPPLEVALVVERDGESVALRDGGGEIVASGLPRLLELEVPALPPADAVESAWRGSPRLQPGAPFPSCVACGPERVAGDGLRIFAGPVEGRDVVAAPWIADSGMVDGEGRVSDRYVWTALDCPSYAALAVGRESIPALLGRICAVTVRPIRAGERTTIVAWPIGVDGRKLHSASALFAADGGLTAYAKMTWIAIQ